jgi:hypothetical protein
MASRFIIPKAFVGNGIAPSDGATLTFTENVTDTPKDTFPTLADALADTNANTNPVIADADGQFGNIFITGVYRVRLKDKNGAQVGFGVADNVSETVGVADANNDQRYGPLFATSTAMVAASPVSIDGNIVAITTGMSLFVQGNATVNDGGEAEYFVKTTGQASSDGDVIDGFRNRTLDTGDVAILVINDVLNAKQMSMGLGNDDTSAWLATVKSDTAIHFPTATYNLNNLLLTGITDLKLTGDGMENSLFDFNLVASGTGLDINFDVPNGGSQRITINDIGFQDSRSTSLVDTMFKFQSGPTGQSPAQTSAFLSMDRCGIRKYNNTSGIGRHLKDVSHVTMKDWDDAFALGVGESLVLENSININTGVYNFDNCVTRATVRPIRIKATSQLMDTFNFNGGFIGAVETTAARECLLIEGTQAVAALNFKGVHWEGRDDTEDSVIKLTGHLRSGSFFGNHFSGGTAIKQATTLFAAKTGCVLGAVTFDANEALRIKDRSSSGQLFQFEDGITTQIDEPIKLGSWFLNTTTPLIFDVAVGATQEATFKALVAQPSTFNRESVGTARVYTLEDSATPTVEGGLVFNIPSVPTNTTITDFVDEYFGQDIIIINTGGGAITFTNGASTIRCVGNADLVIGNNDTVRFTRTSDNHWIQSALVVGT